MSAPPVSDSILSLIGHTPLVRLRAASEAAGAEIFAKCEQFNPGGSVKDRIALYMTRRAEERGDLKPGGVIVEGTAGNTGIGFAVVGAALGYRTVIVMPRTMAREKIDFLRAFGVELHLVDKAPWDDPGHYSHVARRLAGEIPGAWFANQFGNPDNTLCHYETTGPEIWEQMEGCVDALVAGMGSSGTLLGAGRFLKEKNPALKAVCADPWGSRYHLWFHEGRDEGPGSSVIEGVGIGKIPSIYDKKYLDDVIKVDDSEAMTWALHLARREGIFAGGSSGLSLAGAVRTAQKYPGARVACVLPDTGERYLSKLFTEEEMRKWGGT
jgi:cysteine synthase A